MSKSSLSRVTDEEGTVKSISSASSFRSEVNSETSGSSSDSFIEEKTDKKSLAQISAMKKRIRRTDQKVETVKQTKRVKENGIVS